MPALVAGSRFPVGSSASRIAGLLTIALAMASSQLNTAPSRPVIAIGEVGLAGEVRRVSGLPRRLREAARLGFTRAIVPAAALEPDEIPRGLRVLEAADIVAAVDALNS